MYRINFLPERIRRSRRRQQRLRLQAFLTGGTFVLIVLLALTRQHRISSASAALREFDDRTVTLKTQLAARETLQRQQSALMIKQKIDSDLGSGLDTVDILAELSRLMPQDMTLISIDVTTVEQAVASQPQAATGGGPTKAVTVRKSPPKPLKRLKLTLTGLAPNDVEIASFIGQLSLSPLFEEVSMGYSRDVEFRGRLARQFQANCYVVK